MKKLVKLLGISVLAALIGLSFAACNNDGSSEPGLSLIITGLEAYNGQYAHAVWRAWGDDFELLAVGDVSTSPFEVKGARISGGKVTLNVYAEDSIASKTQYSGSDENARFIVCIQNSPDFLFGFGDLDTSIAGLVTANFANGLGTGAFIPNQGLILYGVSPTREDEYALVLSYLMSDGILGAESLSAYDPGDLTSIVATCAQVKDNVLMTKLWTDDGDGNLTSYTETKASMTFNIRFKDEANFTYADFTGGSPESITTPLNAGIGVAWFE